jgi:hypothetical protein
MRGGEHHGENASMGRHGLKEFMEGFMKSVKKKRWLIAGLSFVFAFSSWAFADQKKSSGTAIKIKPDLRILSVKAERSGFTAAGAHRLQVKATVVNSAAGAVCANSFQVRLEKKSPGGAYSRLGQQGVARLCVNPASARMASVTLTFEDTVPAGQQRVWRATADSSSVVDEAREDNNQAESETYVAKTYCPGVDLVLTKVEIFRASGGNVFVRCYGKNRCIGSCVSNVEFTIDVVDPAGAGLGVVQPVGVGIEPLQEFATGAAVGVYSSSERTVTYSIRIDPETRSCTDANPANNSCTVTLRADESRKTVNCH